MKKATNHSRCRKNTIALRTGFSYFKCGACDCIQIAAIPENISKYYPQNYYSFLSGGTKIQTLSFFHKVQSNYLIYGKSKLLGPIFTLEYWPPKLFTWVRNLDLNKNASILDIGSGTGDTLKKMYQLGYKNLTGADPYIKEDYFFTDSFHVYKKDPLLLPEEKKFDCIMMHHSFEHIEFQRPLLQKIKQLLKKQGKLLIRVPVYSEPLWNKYGVNNVFLDAPRHFFIHSIKSMKILCDEANLKIEKVDYDADEFSIWASEEYTRDICLSAPNSCARGRKKSIFSRKDIKLFKKEIQQLNEAGRSDAAAFYISS